MVEQNETVKLYDRYFKVICVMGLTFALVKMFEVNQMLWQRLVDNEKEKTEFFKAAYFKLVKIKDEQ